MKKIFIIILILIIFFSGCMEEKTESIRNHKIELNFYEFDFEKTGFNLEVFSPEELPKTRLEILDGKKEITCLDYFNLKKGKNNIFFDCGVLNKKVFLEITPSNGTTKEFEIEITPKEKIILKKGFKYYFQAQFLDLNIKRDYNIFITDENKEFLKGISYSLIENKNVFSLFLLDKNSFEVYSSGMKNTCSDAYKSSFQKASEEEEILLFPFFLSYAQQDEDFEINEFIKKKGYSAFDTELNIQIEQKIKEKIIFNGFEAYKVETRVNKQKMAVFYIQSKSPYILIYYKRPAIFEFEFKEEIQEEFNENKYSCFSG